METHVTLSARRDAGEKLQVVSLSPPEHAVSLHRLHGQYIEIPARSGGFFALTSDPGATTWELLVRSSERGGPAELLSTAEVGTILSLEGPLGTGFAMSAALDSQVSLAVAGSALGALRSVVRERIRSGCASATRLYLGAQSAARVPLYSEVIEWAKSGVSVVLCFSQAAASTVRIDETIRVERGYVQSVVAQDAARFHHGAVYAAGPGPMLEELRAIVGAFGPLDVRTNI